MSNRFFFLFPKKSLYMSTTKIYIYTKINRHCCCSTVAGCNFDYTEIDYSKVVGRIGVGSLLQSYLLFQGVLSHHTYRVRVRVRVRVRKTYIRMRQVNTNVTIIAAAMNK